MQPTIKTYKFIGKILPDGHLSVPVELREDTGREFEVIMKPVDDIARAISLYLEGKTEKKGRIEDINRVFPAEEIEEAITRTFGTANIDEIVNTVRK